MWIPAAVLALTLVAGHWPVDSPDVLAGFSPPGADWSAGHRGVDFAAATGDRVLAMAGGTVSFVGSIAGKPVVTVMLTGPEHRRSTYEPVVASVAVGDLILPGQEIGTVAVRGGHCGGARGCLHVGLRTDAAYLDPLSLVRPPPAVLKPRGSGGARRPRDG